MTPRDQTEAALLWLLGFFALMLAWCVAEWLTREVWRAWRVRRYLRRVIQHESAVDRSKNALRHTIKRLT